MQSYWRIPELKLGFDLGAQPWDFIGTPTWFVSHTHLDHVAALPVYVARRRMMKMEPPTIYLPELGSRRRPPALAHHATARSRPADLQPDRRQARPGNRVVARSRRHRLRHDAHHSLGRLSGLGTPQQAQGGVSRLARRQDPRPAALRRGGDARDAHADPGLHRRHQSGRPRQLSAACSRPRF